MIRLYPDEKILSELRRHRFILYSEIGRIAAFFIAPFVIFLISAGFFTGIWEAPFRNLFFLGYAIYTLFLWAFLFIAIVDYYLDVWIVTNERIIDIELLGLFRRELSEFKLSRIQDITVEVKGILPTLFNFGDVHIQTAGEARDFLFKQVPHPYEVKKIVLDTHDEYMNHKLAHRHNHLESA